MADPIETGEVSRTTHGNHVHRDEKPAVLNETESRQASRRIDNMRVLIVSLSILAIAAVAIYFLLW